MFETDSTIDKTSPCGPPCLLGEAISPGIKTAIVKLIDVQFPKSLQEVDYAATATGSTYATLAQRRIDDMFRPSSRQKWLISVPASELTDQPMRLKVMANASEERLVLAQSDRVWMMLTLKEFLSGYDEIDNIYDEA